MTSTISVQNVSGIPALSTIALFLIDLSNPLSSVVDGWYVQGGGLLNIPVTNVLLSGSHVRITIATSLFQDSMFYSFTSQSINSSSPCFKEGTMILCMKGFKEMYCPIEDLRKGDLVKTQKNGYVKIQMIGTSLFLNISSTNRLENKMYKCPKENYTDLLDDLYITGTHSILVNTLTEEEKVQTRMSLGKLFLTGPMYRLMAFIDPRAEPIEKEGVFRIYHIALESDIEVTNYGIYANGLLVESCSLYYLKMKSNMTFIE